MLAEVLEALVRRLESLEDCVQFMTDQLAEAPAGGPVGMAAPRTLRKQVPAPGASRLVGLAHRQGMKCAARMRRSPCWFLRPWPSRSSPPSWWLGGRLLP
jgi:hypothetical protein